MTARRLRGRAWLLASALVLSGLLYATGQAPPTPLPITRPAAPTATPRPAATPRPTTSPAAGCATCVVVPRTIDASGATDASAKLQAFLVTVRDGSTIVFPAGAIYRMDVGLLIRNRRNLTFLGNGATLRSGPKGTGQQVESLFYLGGLPVRPSTGITIRGFKLVGNSPEPGVYLRGRPEAAAGISILGGGDIEIDDVTISKVFGDGLTVNAGADGVRFHDSRVISNGRNGVAVINGRNVTVERSRFDKAGYTTFDIEPWVSGTMVRNIRFLDNTVGTWTNSFVSANGNKGTFIDGITVSRNTVTGKSLLTIIDLATRRKNVVFTDNRSAAIARGPVLRLANIDGLTVTGNVQPLSSGLFASITASTGVVYTP